MALVLAIEPDLRQAEILTRIVREKVRADLVIVDSRDAAMEAMRRAVPDVMLLSALLSPRDEDELVGHLRKLEGAEHLQTHTIPQLASSGGDSHSGPARGLLKAFRRKKETAPQASGCDPDLFAEEIRVFLEQAEQQRHERAEELKYRPAGATVNTVIGGEAKRAAEEPEVPAPTTSWDSPFEWRKSDTGPAPLASLEEEPAPAPMKVQPVEDPAPEVDFNWSAHLLEPSSIRAASRSVPEPPPSPAAEPVIGPDHLLEEAHPEPSAAPEPFEIRYEASPEADRLEAHAEETRELPVIPAFDEAAREPETIEAHSEISAEPQAIDAQAVEATPEPETIQAQAMEIAPDDETIPVQAPEITPQAEAIHAEAVEVAPEVETLHAAAVEVEPIQAHAGEIASEADAQIEVGPQREPFEAHGEIFANERLDAPELFETYVPAPVEELESAILADALPAFGTFAPVEVLQQAMAAPEPASASPEEIEAYGRLDVPAVPLAATPEPASAVDESSFAIECILDPGPADEEPAAAMPVAIAASSRRDDPADEEEIDLSWSVDNLQFDAAPADAFDTPHKAAQVEASELENTALGFEQSDAEALGAKTESPGSAPVRRPPVNLGPLATWARAERRTDEGRRPGSDMREIIERLAVPPHIAGVSYARGVRIRRVRVAGTRDRRRPADQSGPVILSRRALAETRSVAP